MCSLLTTYFVYADCKERKKHYVDQEIGVGNSCPQGPHNNFVIVPGSCETCSYPC
ncbi:hypothetical protein B9Z19DRAFT_1078650 [Tuber borchii]|uniref:Uncharacterized protein n=1 Tax=Tuber borchii TaxID=42251 RepID=A0A2T6ZZA1_TUBBO|nr:hypothetical protein B9Z19DRAFT_1078650 [Tuber borchii]